MPGRLLIVVLASFLFACAEADVSAKFYDYQIERLLSGQNGVKIWDQVVNSENCLDSVKLYIEFADFGGEADDSVDISQLIPISNCSSFDTTYLGRADASSFSSNDLFTDSLIFSSGDFWIIMEISSENFMVLQPQNQLSYTSQTE